MVGILVVLALVLITFSFRKPDSGPVASVESAAATVLRPFTIAGERVAQPFRDVYGWADSLLTARSDAKRLRAETEALRQQVIQNQFAANENARLKALLAFRDGPRFPDDYTGLAAAVIARPTGTLRAGGRRRRGLERRCRARCPGRDGGRLPRPRHAGVLALVACHAPQRRAARGVGASTSSRARPGIVKHGRGSASTLIFDRVPKKVKVSVGDTIVTAGWRSSKLASLYPKGIPIGRVTSVGQADTDLWKQIQVEPFADFERVDAVLVLVLKDGQK